MRIWEKIKVNDIVIYQNEEYVVEEIHKDGITTYGIIRNVNTNNALNVPLYSCRQKNAS